jgi:hypothetical protein
MKRLCLCLLAVVFLCACSPASLAPIVPEPTPAPDESPTQAALPDATPEAGIAALPETLLRDPQYYYDMQTGLPTGFIFKEAKDGNLEISILTNEVVWLKDNSLKAWINGQIQTLLQECMNDPNLAQNAPDELYRNTGSHDMNNYIGIDFGMYLCAKGQFLTVGCNYANIFCDKAGLRIETGRDKSICLDLKERKRANLSDLFLPGSDYISVLNRLVKQQMISDGDDDIDGGLIRPFKGVEPNQPFRLGSIEFDTIIPANPDYEDGDDAIILCIDNNDPAYQGIDPISIPFKHVGSILNPALKDRQFLTGLIDEQILNISNGQLTEIPPPAN